MHNAEKNKSGSALYIVMVMILAAIVGILVLSFAANQKQSSDINPKVEENPRNNDNIVETEPEKSAFEETTELEVAQIEEPTEEVDSKEPKFSVPVNGYLLKEFSIDMPIFSVTMNDYRVHNGIDIESELGSPVMAFSDGTVKGVYTDPMMGNCISIEHDNGMVSYYMGLSGEVCEGVVEGAPVFCGQVISSVGDSTLVEIGEETHLHFELTENGNQVDPLSYVSYQTNDTSDAIAKSYEG